MLRSFFCCFMIEINGSDGEGGGALTRVALALSTLTGKSFRVFDIRKNRPEPGLKAQHLTAVEALKQLCGATTSDIHIGSTELIYTPGKLKGGSFSFDIGTAGSISLLLQALLLPLLFAPKKVTLTLTGGTCGLWQAPVEYMQQVLFPFLERFCGKLTCSLTKRGYYPRGGGQVLIEIKPQFSLTDFSDFDLFLAELRTNVASFSLTERGKLSYIRGILHASSALAEQRVAERQAEAAQLYLQRAGVPVTITSEYQHTLSVGSGVVLWARFARDDEFSTVLGASALGERGKRAEDVGKEAAVALLKEIDSCAVVDHYLADQLLSFMALLGSGSFVTSDVSMHARTTMVVIEKFLPVKFVVEGNTVSVTSRS